MEKDLKGFRLYRHVCNRNTVCLNRIMRSKNAAYIQLQEDVRVGNWTTKHIDAVNARFNASLAPINFDDPDVRNNSEADYCPIVVVRNSTRQALYDAHMASISDGLQARGEDRPILLLADVSAAKKKKGGDPILSKHDRRHLDKLPDSNFERTPMGLFLYFGAYVLVTQNLGVQYGIANGTRGKVVGWQFPHGTTFSNVTYHGVRARLPSAPVECVHVKVTNVILKTQAPQQPPDLPIGVISLPRISLQVNDPIIIPTSLSTSKTVNVRLTQVPLRQALILSTYSIQGGQYLRYIIAETTPKNVYVQISRGKAGLASLSLKRYLERTFTKAAMPSQDLATEMELLELLNDKTKAQFESRAENAASSIDEDEPCAKRPRCNSNMSITSDTPDDSDSESSDGSDGEF